jgi:hypothetical protein
MSRAKLTPEQVKELMSELAALSKQQSKALENSAYLGMSASEKAEYNKRRARIVELSEMVSVFKPKP